LRAESSGVAGRVTEIEVLGSRVVVSLTVSGSRAGIERGGNALRWQVYNVRGGRITDIVGFDDRQDAIEFAQTSLLPDI
jgi:hypothetical protein